MPRLRIPVLPVTAAVSAALFALGSWLIVELWAYPRLLASLQRFADQGLSIAAQRDEHPVLRMCLPYLTIALAELAGSLALMHPGLRDATPASRGACLGFAIVVGWAIAVSAFVPPGLTSVLAFSPPALLLLMLSWLVASPLALLLRRRARATRATQEVPDSSNR